MWRLLEHRLSSFEANSAITQSLIRAISEGTAANTAGFYQNSGKVVTIGRYQKQENEVREDYCRRNKIKIQRRLLPGDAILSSEEDVWWEFIAIT